MLPQGAHSTFAQARARQALDALIICAAQIRLGTRCKLMRHFRQPLELNPTSPLSVTDRNRGRHYHPISGAIK
jgi:hypothetical protein